MTSTAPLTGSSRPSRFEVDLAWVVDRWSGVPLSAAPEEELAFRLQDQQRTTAQDAAAEARLILELAARRSAALDPPPEHPGARRPGWSRGDISPEISEFFPAELSMLLNLGRGTAAHRLRRALTWVEKLPATFAALEAGELDERRADALADVLKHTTAEIAGAVEDRLLPEATELSVTRLRTRATELMLDLDAAAAEERGKQAEKVADVHVYPAAAEGWSVLAIDLPTPEAVKAEAMTDALARMLEADGDDRPIGLLRTHVASLLIRRMADSGLPSVAVHLAVTAELTALEGSSSAPGEVNGLAITAAHLRDLLARVGALGLTAPDGGTLSYAIVGPEGELLATVTPAELARLARRGCPDHPGADCSCSVLGPPPATDTYEPTAKQRAFVTTRDRRCRFPNCGQRVGWADLDHVIAHSCRGRTDCANLCCLCRSHHRLKTFAPGWHFHMDPDGTLHVTTPSGVTRTTRPPGMRVRAPDPPEGPPAASPSPDPVAPDAPPF